MIKPYIIRKKYLEHTNQSLDHPMAEADFLTLYNFCTKTFVYRANDDVFSTTTPLIEPTSFNSNNNPTSLIIKVFFNDFYFSLTPIDSTFFRQFNKKMGLI